MAYTNGIFYINVASGNDAARTALTACTASNPSGTITRINKTAHGLVTGAVVDLTLFSAWLNDAWKITVVDANNFDLDSAVWQTTADNSGTVTPRGGSSWTDGWLTVTSGATAARIQPGDEIRLSRTEEISAGVNATFTNASRTVTLASALTKTVQNADNAANWTASANISVGNNATRKIGTQALAITPAAAFTTGKVCYAAVAGGGTQDFSAYTRISFWYRSTSGAVIAANTYKICLCSDAIGDVIVDEFTIDVATTSLVQSFMSLTYNKGSALGNSIRTVAVYAIADPGTNVISINNIIACNAVSLDSIIGPQNDCMYGIQSIDGTTLSIDSATTNVSGQGWSGTTGTVAMYYITPVLSTSAVTVNEAGTNALRTSYIGGYNTTSNLVDGRTYFQNRLFNGNAIALQSHTIYRNLGFFRPTTFFTSTSNTFFYNCVFGNSPSLVQIGERTPFEDCFFLNSSNATAAAADNTTSSPVTIYNCVFANSVQGVGLSRHHRFVKCIFRNNSTGSIQLNTPAGDVGVTGPVLYKCTLSDATEVSINSNSFPILTSYEHDQTAGNNWMFTAAGTVNWQTSVKQGSDPGSWRVTHSGTSRTINYPIRVKVAELAVTASSLVTVSVWVKKDHATNVGCSVFVEGPDYTLTGVVADTETAANNTDWQQLTLTFTPSVAGIVPIWFDSWYVSGNSNTYFGSITVTQ